MNKLKITSLLFWVLFTALGTTTHAKAPTIDKNIKADTVKNIGQLMRDHYVFPEMGKKTAQALQARLEAGDFKDITDSHEFAKALTKAVREITKDKHLRVRPNPLGSQKHSREDAINHRLDRREHSRQANLGISQVRKLDGNVGYLDLRGFHSLTQAKSSLDSAMALLNSSDAIIIDLRKNGGGDPHTVQYLCSYFFDEHLLLNSLYYREGDVTTEFWTLDEVDGDKLPEVPLFILTSGRTFSAAEEFSYNMQTQERATLIGETTGGGANPGGGFKINELFGMFIATGRAINPITKTNWEGVGVVPQIKTDSDNAFGKAVELASEAAEQKRQAKRVAYLEGALAMYQHLDQMAQSVQYPFNNEQETKFFAAMDRFKSNLAMNEIQLNDLGYEYLLKNKQPTIGLLVMKFTARTYPDSANVYDSLGDAWLNMKQPELAKKSFAKGLQLVDEADEALKETLQQNLAKAEQMAQGQ
ncbi:S41 family peptidase [Kangiella shandongensis]|uniref:S41 family peptidase n=1 Tax=Kangiella shandongensis TaxID=2763258 RepID=UPI001CBEAAFE|nr:S41 family peptidase [Kangiella shandongensis]